MNASKVDQIAEKTASAVKTVIQHGMPLLNAVEDALGKAFPARQPQSAAEPFLTTIHLMIVFHFATFNGNVSAEVLRYLSHIVDIVPLPTKRVALVEETSSSAVYDMYLFDVPADAINLSIKVKNLVECMFERRGMGQVSVSVEVTR